MKVTLKEWNAVATWRWDMPEDEVCGICRVQFDGTCPTCKFPGDDCSLLLGKCGHSFHMHCLMTWIQQESSKGLCPMCRQSIYLISRAMSLPKSSPFLSPSPSKLSIRRAPSRPQSIDQPAQPAQTVDTPDDPAANVESQYAEDEQEREDQSLSSSHILSQPFFTLIEDTHTSEYYHPTVHYIFSDDDTDIVTEAALRSLESDQDVAQNSDSNPNTTGKGKALAHHQPIDADGNLETYEDESPARKESLLPDPIPGVKENYIILDIDHTPTSHGQDPEHESERADPGPGAASLETQTQGQGQGQGQGQTQDKEDPPQPFKITSAHSLSPAWQVLTTDLLPAPTFENNPPSENPANGGLMLQIQGTSGLPMGVMAKDKERGSQRLEDMMDQFARRLDELKQVIECGEQGMSSDFDVNIGVDGTFHGVGMDADAEQLEGPGAGSLSPDIPREIRPEHVHEKEAVAPNQDRGAQ
ncbi:anaphase-promoting complex subunit 11 RING-H2 finger-domain-containing protein [Aspergillus californicus]